MQPIRFAIRWILLVLAVGCLPALADTQPINWEGNFAPCNRRSELLKSDHMDLSVRFSTSNRVLVSQFRKAMDFWAKVLDMDWYDDNSSFCSIQLVEGDPVILQNTVVARSQFTDRPNFQGFIAFDPNAPLTAVEMYLTAVHEIGHMLGLKHNPNANSVMYHIDLEGPEVLDQVDLASLAKLHKFRKSNASRAISVSRPLR